jgi:hypothetical protein
MAMRAFEEEAGLYSPNDVLASLPRSPREQPLEGLQSPHVILFETGQAVAAALAAGVLFCALLQGIGVR